MTKTVNTKSFFSASHSSSTPFLICRSSILLLPYLISHPSRFLLISPLLFSLSTPFFPLPLPLFYSTPFLAILHSFPFISLPSFLRLRSLPSSPLHSFPCTPSPLLHSPPSPCDLPHGKGPPTTSQRYIIFLRGVQGRCWGRGSGAPR